MLPNAIKDLEIYKRDCKYLASDIDRAIQDYKSIKTGETIYYAIDFSEIFAYILPSEMYSDFILFPDAFHEKEEQIDAIALQQLVLNYIFFELPSSTKPILLPPYAVELKTFIKKLQGRFFVDEVNQEIEVFKTFEKIINKGLDKQIDKILQKKTDHTILSENEEKKLAKFVQDYGHIESALEIHKEKNHPFERLRFLQPDKTFNRLDKIASLPSQIETKTLERWLITLGKRRGHEGEARTELDAAAVNQIYEINRFFKKNNRNAQLIFITRSKTMHELYQDEVKKGLWSEVGEFLFRHPRAFSITLVVNQKSEGNENDLQDLEGVRDTIKNFLEIYKQVREIENLKLDQHLFNEIDKTKNDWKRIQKTALSLSKDATSESPPELIDNIAKAERILKLARGEYRNIIVDNLSRLFYDVDVSHDILALELQLPGRLHLRELQHPLDISSLSVFGPYKLYLDTKGGKEVMDSLTGKSITKRDVMNAFRDAFEQGNGDKQDKEDYERYLVMAYLLGLLENWGAAENYCIRAVNMAEQIGIGAYQAKYFQAICIRELRISNPTEVFTEEWLSIILSLLKRANEELGREKFNRQLEAQLWLERGISILLFHQYYKGQIRSAPVAEEGIRIIEQWEAKANDNLPLRLIALKTSLDYYLKHGKPEDIRALRDTFVLLHRAVLEITKNYSNLPSYLVDAIIWTNWVLFPETFAESSQREMAIKTLGEAQIRENNPHRKKEIILHSKDIQDSKSYM